MDLASNETTKPLHAAYLDVVEAFNRLAQAVGEPELRPISELQAEKYGFKSPAPPKEKPGFDFNFPETGWRKQPHPGTMRASVLDMLLKGATFTQIEEAVGNMTPTTKHTLRTRTFRVIRDMHYRLGFRMSGNPGDNNIIKAYPLDQQKRE